MTLYLAYDPYNKAEEEQTELPHSLKQERKELQEQDKVEGTGQGNTKPSLLAYIHRELSRLKEEVDANGNEQHKENTNNNNMK